MTQAVTVTVSRPPALTRASESAIALIDVTNRSGGAWERADAVTVYPAWLDAQGVPLESPAIGVHLMAGRLDRDETERLCVEVIAPPTPGRYALGWRVESAAGTLLDAEHSPWQAVHLAAGTSRWAPAPVSPRRLFLWLILTLAEIAAAGVLGWRLLEGDVSLEARVFAAVGSVTAVLLAGLHLAALSTGITLASVTLAWVILLLVLRWAVPSGRAAVVAPLRGARAEKALGVAGAGVLAAILLQWWPSAAASLAIGGTDAAHYHVPNAVNLALGARLFEPPATQHLYPMSSSVLAAWAIVATGDGLLVDLAMVPAFALFAASLALLVHQLTGRAGYAWAPWVVLLLFSTPLFRWSSLVSADLPFAAGTVALAAALTGLHVTTNSTAGWWLLAAMATGGLVGTKTTGAVAAALLWASLAVTWSAGRLARRRPSRLTQAGRAPHAPASRGVMGTAAVALLFVTLTGGIWLVRNWMLFGSPLAPASVSIAGVTLARADGSEAPRGHLSVMRDVRTVSNYDLPSRLRHFSSQWLTPWFAPSLLFACPLLIDLLAARRSTDLASRARRFVVFTWLVVSAGLVSVLIDAPWTSLESTRGFSLRYLLPLFGLAAVLSLSGGLLLVERVRRSGTVQQVMGLALAAVSLWVFLTHATTAGAGGPASVPRLGAVPLGLALMAAATLVAWRRRAGVRRRLGAAIVTGAALTVGLAATTVARGATKAREARLAEVRTEAACFGAANAPPTTADAALRYLALRHESSMGVACEARRFLSAYNLDFPVEFQGLPYDSRLVAARPRGAAEYLARRPAGIDACDYVITHESVEDADLVRHYPWVAASGATWRRLGEADRYALFGVAVRGVRVGGATR